MIEYILNALNTREEKSQEDYITALAAFRGGGALEEEEAEKLAGIYEKYSRDAAHPELARLYMALDMLPGRSREDAAVFAALGLPQEDLDALFTAREMSAQLTEKEPPDEDVLEAAIEAATGGALSRPIDLFLARVLLNDLAWRWDFGGFRQQAARLAEFLIAAGPEVMTEYTIFLEEAGKKCRN